MWLVLWLSVVYECCPIERCGRGDTEREREGWKLLAKWLEHVSIMNTPQTQNVPASDADLRNPLNVL